MMLELMRHGQTVLQAQHRYVGSTDDSLSDEGADALVAVESETCPCEVFVTSLQRTAQTAHIVFPDAELRVVPGLEEMNFGAFETHRADELESDPRYRAWVDGGCTDRCPGGESKTEFSARACAAFSELLDRLYHTTPHVAPSLGVSDKTTPSQTPMTWNPTSSPAPANRTAPRQTHMTWNPTSTALANTASPARPPIPIVAHGGTIMAVMERFGRPGRSFFEWRVPWGCGLLLDASEWKRSHILRLVRSTTHLREDLCP